MAWYVEIGGKDEFVLASLSGWKFFKEWVHGFENYPYPLMWHFMEYGYVEDKARLPGVIAELENMLHRYPNEVDRSIIEQLIESIQLARPESVIMVLTNGMESIPDDDDDDDDDDD
jgi:hypothetical protein